MPPSNRIALGFIGTGDHGVNVNLKSFLSQPDAQVVALCDVDQARVDHAREMVERAYGAQKPSGVWRGCRTTRDWREIIASPDIDAVVISTPDHWHAIPSVTAAKAGKDVFCEKPLSLTVREGRIITDTMREYGRVFQVGTPNRSRHCFLQACEAVRNGRIGKLHTIKVQIWRGHGAGETDERPNETSEAPPKGFDYDMWLGQAPEAPYCPARCHFNFRYNQDYSSGNLTDFGAHLLDVAQWGNNTEDTGPVSIEGTGTFPRDGLYDVPTDWDVVLQYDNGVRLECKSGGYYVRFEGDAGWVQADGFNISASSPALLRPPSAEDVLLRTCAAGEQRDFLDCVKTRAETYAPAEIEHRSITLAHLMLIAMLRGHRLEWNPVTEQFVNDEEANRRLSRAMRSPWVL